MKYALVDGQRREAERGLSGKCPSCGGRMVAKCGAVKIRHWSHHGERDCDIWWENETPWHRAWKDQFPVEWQEVVHFSESGETHRADVKTDQGLVVEFQHSYLDPEERRARDAFYKKLVWVVNGARLKTGVTQFIKALNTGNIIMPQPRVVRIFPDECPLLQKWSETNAPVFFDFGEKSAIWYLVPKNSDGMSFVAISRVRTSSGFSAAGFREPKI